uniref:Translation initiation factor eIF2B subunit beta n=1 Tax=Trypanosoma congolense (strain IL3000) TaxID=1068625 RepID=G0US29_TRYCI|nr:putative translation initiation factor eif-2b beta subunit [Trypanosoma congolense IL3000]
MVRRHVRVHDDASPLMEAIGDLIETFVGNVRRGKLGPRDGKSFSMTAASESVQLLHTVITLFREHGEKLGAAGGHILRSGFITTKQIQKLLWLVSFTGDAMLRAQFGTLLLTNVTRRVLSFIRTATAECKANAHKLENPDSRAESVLRSQHEDHAGQRKKQKQQRRGGKQRDNVARSTAGDETDSTTHSNDPNENFDEEQQEILTIGIPGRQTLRRAPSRRELEGSMREEVEVHIRADDFFNCVSQYIEQFSAEIEGMCDALCDRAVKQLHSTDTVITTGSSHTTRRYLLHALATGASFKVIILEGAPMPSEASHKLASELRSKHAEVQVLPDSSAFAVMGTCTKVLIGVENVLANGGILAPIGTHPLCIAAKHFAVPVLVVTTTIKMTPFYPSDAYCTSLVKISRSSAQEIPWNTYGSPGDVLPAPYGADVETFGSFVVHSPVTEYVPPELITLYATNESEYTPSQIHRIVRENYSPED